MWPMANGDTPDRKRVLRRLTSGLVVLETLYGVCLVALLALMGRSMARFDGLTWSPVPYVAMALVLGLYAASAVVIWRDQTRPALRRTLLYLVASAHIVAAIFFFS
ncbi:hypothetical protein SAMN06309944_0986 [Micrococcales bacterium KH10]|nr:hypothetical protein SAMN06309944_0986 [Micrococcales bacterium KH10]